MPRKFVLAVLLVLHGIPARPAVATAAPDCPVASTTGPTTASAAHALEGALIYHDGIRQWFELKLDQAGCGQSSVQLIGQEGSREVLQLLRGCRVRSTGPIDFSPTGYYSLDTWQDVEKIEALGSCARQLPFPDYSKAMPDKAIQKYRVDMRIEYASGDHPIIFTITSHHRELKPWQAYANYLLTGSFVLYGSCGEGFVVATVFGTPQAGPSHFAEPRTGDDMAAFNPEGAAALGVAHLRLGYTCERARR